MSSAADLDPGRRDRLVVRICVSLMLAHAAIGIAVPAGLGWDFANFYDAGRRVAAGQVADLFEPERPIAGAPPQGRLAFWSTPISAALYAPLSLLAPETALVVFKLENTLALLAALVLLYRFDRRFSGHAPVARRRFAALFAFACLIYQPLWSVYRVGGQTTPTVLLLLGLGLLCHVRARLALASLCFVAAVLIKPALVTGLALLAVLSGARFAALAALELGVAGLISLAAMGFEVHATFLAKLLHGAAATHPWTSNSSLYVGLGHLHELAEQRALPRLAPGAIVAVARAIQLAVLALVVWLARASRAEPWSGAARRHFDFQLSLLFFLLVSQTLWEHYLGLLFPFLAFAVASRAALSRAARGIVAAIFGLAIGQHLVIVMVLRDRFGFESGPALLAISLFKSAPLLLVLLLLLRHRAELFAAHRGAAWLDASADAAP